MIERRDILNQTQYEILKVLYNEDKISAVNSVTLKALIEKVELSFMSNTIYKQLLILIKNHYIANGLRVGKENTYYITDLGIKIKSELEG